MKKDREMPYRESIRFIFHYQRHTEINDYEEKKVIIERDLDVDEGNRAGFCFTLFPLKGWSLIGWVVFCVCNKLYLY